MSCPGMGGGVVLRRCRALAAAVLLVAAGSPHAQEPDIAGLPDGWAITRFQWQGELEAAHTVAVTNQYGDIRARAAISETIEVLAVLQHAEDERTPPRVTVSRKDGRIQLTVEMPDANRSEDSRRVDVSLFVPKTARLVAVTRSGLIEAKKLTSDIEAVAERGDIRVSTRGTVNLRTSHGSVVATLLDPSWAAPPTIATTTGLIELWLTHGVEPEIVAETTGLLTTDYSVDVRYDALTAKKHAALRIGAARGVVRLTSAKGDIRILRSAIRSNSKL